MTKIEWNIRFEWNTHLLKAQQKIHKELQKVSERYWNYC